jgi:hypothetical protein
MSPCPDDDCREIVIPSSVNLDNIQSAIDLMVYKAATARSQATQDEVDSIAKEAKKGWWSANRDRFIFGQEIKPFIMDLNLKDSIKYILQSGAPLSSIISGTGKYTFHNLRTRDMLSILLNAEEPEGDRDSIVKMNPVYQISFQEMKQAIIVLAKNLVK